MAAGEWHVGKAREYVYYVLETARIFVYIGSFNYHSNSMKQGVSLEPPRSGYQDKIKMKEMYSGKCL